MEILTLLDEKNIKESNVFKRIDKHIKLSDLALVRGGYISPNDYGWQWTKSCYSPDLVKIIDHHGDISWDTPYRRNGGIRPVINYSLVKDYTYDNFSINGIDCITFGNYYQTIADDGVSKKLSKNFNKYCNGNYIYFDSCRYDSYDKPFNCEPCYELEFNDDKYLYTRVNSCGKSVMLSNDITYNYNDYVFLKREPVIWILDNEKDILISANCLLSGIQFDDREYTGDFVNTNLARYMNIYMLKDIIDNDVIYNDIISKYNGKEKVRKLKI